MAGDYGSFQGLGVPVGGEFSLQGQVLDFLLSCLFVVVVIDVVALIGS